MICQNGMTGWFGELEFRQTHQDPFQPALLHQGVEAVVNGSEQLEERLEYARDRTFQHPNELRLLMHDLGLDWVVENPEAEIPMAIEEERALLEDDADLSLYNAYNAATRLINHYSRDSLDQHQLNSAYDRAASLLESGEQEVPDPDELAEEALSNRAVELSSDRDVETNWTGENQDVRELMESRGLARTR
jgi:hypothetical protein